MAEERSSGWEERVGGDRRRVRDGGAVDADGGDVMDGAMLQCLRLVAD